MVQDDGASRPRRLFPRCRLISFLSQVGYGTEATHFALELTYNYGIPGYQLGDDLRFIALSKTALRDPSAVTRDAQGREVVVAPDGYTFLLVDAPAAANGDPFLFVSLHVRDAAAAAGFYERVLGAAALPAPAGATPGAVHVGWGAAGQSHLELVSLGRSVDRATASGRFATETEDGAPGALGAAVAGEGTGTVLHGPVVLQPHGEEVVIAQDADGHEYCFVDARGYRACTAVAARQGGTDVDWPYRARLEAAAALTGEAAKRGVAAVLAGEYDVAAMSARLDALIAQAPAVVFSQTSCPFCKKAKTLLSDLGAAYATVELDTLGAEGHALRAELGKRTGRTSVPAVFVGGQCLGGYGDGPGVGPLAEQGKLGPLLQAAGAL